MPDTDPLLPAELQAALDTLRWSSRILGREVGLHHEQVRRWLTLPGSVVPAEIGDWLRLLAAFHRAHPPPQGRGMAPKQRGRPRKTV